MITVYLHGIDFSGDAQMWRPSVRRSNVWVSTAQVHEELMEVVELLYRTRFLGHTFALRGMA